MFSDVPQVGLTGYVKGYFYVGTRILDTEQESDDGASNSPHQGVIEHLNSEAPLGRYNLLVHSLLGDIFGMVTRMRNDDNFGQQRQPRIKWE